MHAFGKVHFLDWCVGLWDLLHETADGVDTGDIDCEGEGGGQDVGSGDDEDVVELAVAEVGLDYGVCGGEEEEDEEEEEEEGEGGRVEEAMETVESHCWVGIWWASV